MKIHDFFLEYTEVCLFGNPRGSYVKEPCFIHDFNKESIFFLRYKN